MNKIIIWILLLISIMMSVSSKSWMNLWINLEINMVSFIPIMNINKFNFKIKSTILIKYFLIQTFSSMIFLSSMLMLFLYMNNILLMNIMLLIISATMIKLAIFPFHEWFINLMINLKWINCIILSTIQKIIPLFMIMNLPFNNLLNLSIMFTSIMSSLCGINTSMLKKIWGYSSMNHSSWMILIMINNYTMFYKYLILYYIINTKIMLIMNYFNLNLIPQLFYKKINNSIKLNLFILIISLAALPPFLGFIMKWFSLNLILKNSSFLLMLIIMMIFSTMILLFYIQILIPNLILNSSKFKNNYSKNFNKHTPLTILLFSSIYFLMFNNILF